VRQLICEFILLLTAASLSAGEPCLTLRARGSELWVGQGSDARFLINDSLGIVKPQWSPDGHRIAYVHASPQSQDGVTDVIVLDTRNMSLIPVANLTWEDSVKGVLRLGWHGDDAVWIEGHVNPSTSIYDEWNVTTKERVRELAGMRFAWSPDGQHLAYLEHRAHFTPDASRPPAIVIDGRRIWSATDVQPRIESPLTWSPDSKRLAFISGDGEKAMVRVIDITGRAAPKSLAIGEGRPTRVQWHGEHPVPVRGEEDNGCGSSIER
jgi:dipeptidyl aminopeptidase/acylaminoacyl peptidase